MSPRQGVVAIIQRDEALLVIKRSSLVVAPDAFCFPGGGIEEGETEEAALRRELLEELGVVVEPERCVWRSQTPWNVELGWWTARLALPEVTFVPSQHEVAEIHWLRIPEILALPNLLASNVQFLERVMRGEVLL